MTFRELQKKLATLTEEQLDCTVLAWLGTTDEYCEGELRISDDGFPPEQSVIDIGNPVIYVPEG
jgi:hypothetical protein